MKCDFSGTISIPVGNIVDIGDIANSVIGDNCDYFNFNSMIVEKKFYKVTVSCGFRADDGVECNLIFEQFLALLQLNVGEGLGYDMETNVGWKQ